MKKLLLFFALLCAFAQGAWADDGWSVWNGGSIYFTHEPANPPTVVDDWVQINSADDLVYVTLNWNKCLDGHTDLGVYYKRNYQLNVNLDLTSETWQPLGRFGYEANENGFEGFFNGNGHTIKLKIEDTDENNQGLFYEIHPTGKVWDLHVDCDIRVGNARLVGGIAGENNGTIQNCWVSGHIESSHYSQYDADLGGIAGLNENEGDILYCCVTADVKNTGGNSGVGGIAGSNEGEIYHVTFYGDVSVNHAQYNKYVGDQNQQATLEYYYDTFNQGEYDTAGPENQNQKLYARAIKYPTITTYTINNADDWDEFVMYIRNGHLFSGKTVQLANNISVTTTAGGGESNSFQGTFDGDGHTLTLNVSNQSRFAAPFKYVSGATIKNLKTAGSISGTGNADGKLLAGIVGHCMGNTTITNCISSMALTTDYGDDAAMAGLVAATREGSLTISGCVFNGSMTGASNTRCAGIVGYEYLPTTTVITNTLFAPSTLTVSTTDDGYTKTFTRDADATINHCYYTQTLGAAQGTEVVAYTSVPANLGSLVQDYGLVKAYANGILYDSKYYSAASSITGSGTDGDPYIIGNADSWNEFAQLVNNGTNVFNSKFVKLNADISVSNMVGVDDPISFQGTFDGDGHKLTFTKGTSLEPFDENYCAPFRHVKDATIKNLHVDGTINTSAQFAGGIVGESHKDLNITNCRSSVAINSSVSGDGTHGGLVSTLSGSGNTIIIEGCVFDGSFATSANTTNCGGFIGWGVYNKPTVKNSLMKPSSVPAGMLIYTFARWYTGDGGIYEPTIDNCFFFATSNLPTNQGTEAVTDAEILPVGDPVAYNVSGITAYVNGISYGGNFYYNPDRNIKREITGYGEGSGNWAFIASPVEGSIAPTAVSNLIGAQIQTTPSVLYDYDLFRLNSEEWENYVQHTEGFNIVNGQGYLYASNTTKNLVFSGIFNTDDSKTVALSEGFNLVGNPFAVNAYVSKPFYQMNAEGTDIVAVENYDSYTPVAIPPCTGIVVRASGADEVTFSTSAPQQQSSANNGNLQITLTKVGVRSDAFQDKAIVSFNEGSELEKFIFNERHAKLYIPQYGEDYAIASSEMTGELPLNFKTRETGRYTIGFNFENVKGVRIQLIDKIEDNIIDLNKDVSGNVSTYTFMGSSIDRDDRFTLVFTQVETDGVFAYQSGNDIIVSGEGELQVFDVMGRMVMTQNINGVETVEKPSITGVYIFRLNEKSQKMVVR